ncbi:hypothetical protein Rhe02_12800 [Rhizocola hellebori]|uniref:Uncharacterized protein n=1 Tax=Rhizocola hellebori TaxID=1392758 RepID=A0A8J3Q3F0_9ACTN|nr:hypothetical protein [Rhizocola hellebori]GIH03213.1 hypothetical protein Rhe02_12800 [Rhizocola hellebori]
MPIAARRYLPLPLLCAALLLTGCGGQATPSAAPTAVTTLGEQALPPTASPSPTKASPKPSTPAPVTYPSEAKAYAEAVIAAWKAKNLARLADLASAQIQEQLMEIPGPPNMDWTYLMCDGAMGSSYCQFTNTDGHKVTVRVLNEKVGQAHAVSEVKYV